MLLSRLTETRRALVATRSRNAKRDLIAAVLRDVSGRRRGDRRVLSVRRAAPAANRSGLADAAAGPAPGRRVHLDRRRGRRRVRGDGRAERIRLGAARARLRCRRCSAAPPARSRSSCSDSSPVSFGRARWRRRCRTDWPSPSECRSPPYAARPCCSPRPPRPPRCCSRRGCPVWSASGCRSAPPSSRCWRRVPRTPRARGRARAGCPCWSTTSWTGSGSRCTASGEEVRVFTRSLDDITGRLPEVVAVTRSLPQQRLVLDGEVLSLRADGRPEAFQVVASRTMSSVDVPAAGARACRCRCTSSTCCTWTAATCWTRRCRTGSP